MNLEYKVFQSQLISRFFHENEIWRIVLSKRSLIVSKRVLIIEIWDVPLFEICCQNYFDWRTMFFFLIW
jgi:hypothetical protein